MNKLQSFVFPGNIDESIMSIGAQPFMYMRTDAFSAINKESEQMLLKFIHFNFTIFVNHKITSITYIL